MVAAVIITSRPTSESKVSWRGGRVVKTARTAPTGQAG